VLDKFKYTDKELDELVKSLTILVDTREKNNQHLLDYWDDKRINHKKKALSYGDYSFMIPKNEEIFTLKAEGMSMKNVGIYDGDVVIVKRTSTAKNGDYVVALDENGFTTLKTFYKEDGHFRLQPENETLSPIILDKVTILGIAIGLYRQF